MCVLNDILKNIQVKIISKCGIINLADFNLLKSKEFVIIIIIIGYTIAISLVNKAIVKQPKCNKSWITLLIRKYLYNDIVDINKNIASKISFLPGIQTTAWTNIDAYFKESVC